VILRRTDEQPHKQMHTKARSTSPSRRSTSPSRRRSRSTRTSDSLAAETIRREESRDGRSRRRSRKSTHSEAILTPRVSFVQTSADGTDSRRSTSPSRRRSRRSTSPSRRCSRSTRTNGPMRRLRLHATTGNHSTQADTGNDRQPLDPSSHRHRQATNEFWQPQVTTGSHPTQPATDKH